MELEAQKLRDFTGGQQCLILNCLVMARVSQNQCALNDNGQLKDADNIEFYASESDLVALLKQNEGVSLISQIMSVE